MDTTLLRRTLLDASADQLGEVIDWLDRPWAPASNDALRAAWHESRRSDGARRALAYAIEQEVRGLGERDAAHVAQKLGLSVQTADAVVAEITRCLGPVALWPFQTSPALIASALRATAEIARLVLGTGGKRRGHRRRHRHVR